MLHIRVGFVEIWECPKIRGYCILAGVLHPTFSGTILGLPLIGNPHLRVLGRGEGGRGVGVLNTFPMPII